MELNADYWDRVTTAIESFGITRSDAQAIVETNDKEVTHGYRAGLDPECLAADLMNNAGA